MSDGEVFFGDDTPWYCAHCGDEIVRGEEMVAYYEDGHRIEVHVACRLRAVTAEVDASQEPAAVSGEPGDAT